MPTLHLLLGPNAYALATERRRWVNEFTKKHGDENMVLLDSTQVSYRELRDEVATGPFIGTKRLLVLNGVPKGGKGEVASVLELLHPEVILLVVLEAELGKRAKYTVVQKDFIAAATVKEFPQLSSPQLKAWLEGEAQALGATFAPATADLLLEQVGADQMLLAQELKKLALFAAGRPLTADDLKNLVVCGLEQEIWQLMDYLGRGDSAGALRFTKTLFDRGLSPHAFWNTFLWMVALLTQVAAAAQQGTTNPWDISKDMKLSYPGVKALLPLGRRLNQSSLARLVNQVTEADKDLKTGALKATAQQPEELLALIDHSLLTLRVLN